MTVHFILSGETLESISEEIKLENPKYLKEFHNQHCAKEDYILDELIPRKRLLIPDAEKIREYNSRNDAPFKAPELNPKLNFNPENFSKIFSVVINETKEIENITDINRISYTVSIKWIRTEDNNHIFHLFRNNFSEEKGSMMADLAAESMRLLNPVEVKTNEIGEVLEISIQKRTIDHFKNIKERLTDLFPDKYAGIYIEEFEFIALNKDLFDQRMKEDTLIKAFFGSLRSRFTNGKSFFNYQIDDDILLSIQQKVDNNNNKDEINLIQFITKLEKDKNFNGKYILDANSGMIKELVITYFISQYSVKYTTEIIVNEMM
ncbi:hypothetical protein SAMN05421664_0636 [Chryseobacterium soldanellicola]|uniref:LysM domain-containing protein n=1 Tax=Chryseobacterium soldanellicola TaxID=311333 RepID=A0A1H0YC26_9FLAO|nr:hypothetical protein [Chryseobacterium soldanellicola]SDQ12789.1 hypothetical protein SAMN05421664_0636 [Chryseobacterium soldanellicola]